MISQQYRPSQSLTVRMMSVRSTQVVTVMFPENPVSFTKWQKRFRRSSAVHFFSKNTFDLKVLRELLWADFILCAGY